jgi:hypothetical protein
VASWSRSTKATGTSCLLRQPSPTNGLRCELTLPTSLVLSLTDHAPVKPWCLYDSSSRRETQKPGVSPKCPTPSQVLRTAGYTPRDRCALYSETSIKRPVQNSLLISTIAHCGVVRGSEALVLICRYVVVNTVPRNSPESSLRPAGLYKPRVALAYVSLLRFGKTGRLRTVLFCFSVFGCSIRGSGSLVATGGMTGPYCF